jgi:hypothetical protein
LKTVATEDHERLRLGTVTGCRRFPCAADDDLERSAFDVGAYPFE